jgi:methionyl-tRNA synthetase
VGYFASFKKFCEEKGLDAEAFFRPGNNTELVHFIGKDILYFHALFWPAMLEFSGFRTPTKVNAHGFLTVDGAKMSKSRGTFITAESYLQQKMNPEWLRYYFAAKLNSSMEDLDLNFNDFIARVNSDLVGKYINIASRTVGFLVKRFNGQPINHVGNELIQYIREQAHTIAAHYDQREFAKALRDVMALADKVNAYVDHHKPWDLAKHADKAELLHEVCSVCLEAFRLLTLLLKPVLPQLAINVEHMLGLSAQRWADIEQIPAYSRPIASFQHLLQRVDPKTIEALIAANRETLAPTPNKATDKPAQTAAHTKTGIDPVTAKDAYIGIEDFAKIDLRIGHILECTAVEGSTKLLQLTVNVGEEKPRNIFSGIAAHYLPEQLRGQYVVVVANLAPRKMKFGVSEGMVLCASADDHSSQHVLSADQVHQLGLKAGMKVS